jgi:hypothetical protein
VSLRCSGSKTTRNSCARRAGSRSATAPGGACGRARSSGPG